MGSFYANVTLLGTELDAVQRVAPRPAFLLANGGAVSALELEPSAVGWGFRYLSTDPSGYSGPPLVEV